MNKIFAWITGIFVILFSLLGMQTKRVNSEKIKIIDLEKEIDTKRNLLKDQIEAFKKHETMVESVVKKQQIIDTRKIEIDEEIKNASKQDKAEAIKTQIIIGNNIATDWNDRHGMSDTTPEY